MYSRPLSFLSAALLIFLSLLPGAVSTSAQVPPGLEELTRSSRLIFVGRVEHMHDSQMKQVPTTNCTVVVRVDPVLDALAGFTNPLKQLMMVSLAGSTQSIGFFPWIERRINQAPKTWTQKRVCEYIRGEDTLEIGDSQCLI